MVVECLQVEGAVDGEVAVAVDGVAVADAFFRLRTFHPGIAGGIGGVAVDPVEDGQFVQRQLVAGGDLLLIVERRTEVLDALPDGVLPGGIPVGIEVLVHRRIGLLDLCTGARLETEVQVLGEVPAQGEVTVPEELLVPAQGHVLVLCTLKVALLHLVVVSADLGVEADVLRQVIESESLGEGEPLRLALEALEGFPGLIDGRIAVVERSAPFVTLLIDGRLARGIEVGVTV